MVHLRPAMLQLLHQAMAMDLLLIRSPILNAALANKDLLDLLDHLVMTVKTVVTETRVTMERLDVTVVLNHLMDFNQSPA